MLDGVCTPPPPGRVFHHAAKATEQLHMHGTSCLLKPGSTILLLSLATACGGELMTTGRAGGGGSDANGGADGGSTTLNGGGGNGGSTSGRGGGLTSDGGSTSDGGGGAAGDDTPPMVLFTAPADTADDVVLNANISATFNEVMEDQTITDVTFVLMQGVVPVLGAVTYAGTVATLDPTRNLLVATEYTATITTDATDLAGNALEMAETWTFKTGSTIANGPAIVNLGTAVGFAILSKSGIATVPASVVTGHIGVSPIDSTALTGFTLTLAPSGTFSTSTQVIGNAYAADYMSPTPSNLTVAIGNMETAYTDAAGRPLPNFTELGDGDISGLNLVPGLYKWGTGVLIKTDVTLDGGANDVWIFQIAGGITQASDTEVLLAGGALPGNIFWQAAGTVALDTGAHLEGNVLSQTEITLATGASINGRLLAQTAVTLDAATVTKPQ